MGHTAQLENCARLKSSSTAHRPTLPRTHLSRHDIHISSPRSLAQCCHGMSADHTPHPSSLNTSSRGTRRTRPALGSMVNTALVGSALTCNGQHATRNHTHPHPDTSESLVRTGTRAIRGPHEATLCRKANRQVLPVCAKRRDRSRFEVRARSQTAEIALRRRDSARRSFGVACTGRSRRPLSAEPTAHPLACSCGVWCESCSIRAVSSS